MKIWFKKGILNMEDLKIVSCSVVFLANNAPSESESGELSYTPKDDIFMGLMNPITLRLILQNCCKGENIEIKNIRDISSFIPEFESNNGLKFIFERPLKFSIIYDANIGKEKDPEQYVKDIANEMIKESGKKKVGSVGINYDFFGKCDNPSERLKKNFLCNTLEDETVEKTAIVVSYRKDAYTKLNLSIADGSTKDEKGLLYRINFDCKIKGENNIDSILKENNFKKFAGNKIKSLMNK
jgi:hypothetical protein